jgi:mannose-1-phosphate guanylyltransferase
MAGGSGTRFWPHSRRAKPKQFLAIVGQRTLLDTAQRLRAVVPMRRLLVVAPRELAGLVTEQLPRLPAENLLIEPAPRGTTPCLVLAAAWIAQRDPHGSMAVFPADHAITDVDRFRGDVERGFEIAEREEALVTFGIRPTSRDRLRASRSARRSGARHRGRLGAPLHRKAGRVRAAASSVPAGISEFRDVRVARRRAARRSGATCARVGRCRRHSRVTAPSRPQRVRTAAYRRCRSTWP